MRESIDEIPFRIRQLLQEDLGGTGNDAGLSESEIRPVVESVFGEEYRANLKKWVRAIGALEDRGYGRDGIVSLLYSTPIDQWPNLARRMPAAQAENKAG